MKISNSSILISRVVFCALFFFTSIVLIRAQSNNQSYPTPITTNELNGKIPARDIGDARLTNYFYTFNGNQGDVFINVVTKNLDGDIDIFTADNLKPLTKITIYSDVSQNETGRVIYLRKPEKLILRIQGRTPNDDPATFTIKFAGSFAPAPALAENEIPEKPEVKSEIESGVRVNSVGTIIEVKPKPTPEPKIEVAKNETKPNKKEKSPKPNKGNKPAKPETENKKSDSEKNINVTVKEETAANEIDEEKSAESKPETVITDKTGENKVEEKAKSDNEKDKTIVTIEKSDEAAESAENKESKNETKSAKTRSLEDIRLIVIFTNGTKIERPISQILRFGVDQGILTIITKEGKIGRYSILDVVKMTVE